MNTKKNYTHLKVDEEIDFGKEAIRLIKSMPNWIPAKADGNLIRVAYVLPINFTL